MRLNRFEIRAIKEVTEAVFGSNTEVQLFGSRTNDSLKGGDIDLLIHCNRSLSSAEQYLLKIKFLVQLKKIIGDQKIDVLVQGTKNQKSMRSVEDKKFIL